MKRLAESYLGRSISKAVIAASIYFNDAQKKELELVGKLAGLDVLGIVDEPFFFLASKNIDGGIFAFSLGGGTFNISILEISDGVIEKFVAIGALLQGALIIEDRRKLSCHLISLSLGIETLGGGFARIIDRHSVIPCMASRNITTPLDYPDSLSIRILQGEHQIASMNDLLGELKVTGIPRAPCGVVSIKLDFYVDKKGFLTVLAKSKDTDFEWSMETNYLGRESSSYPACG
ncbi:Chaperone protein DnaK [Camellia lanceoleosa]|uniref:Chaperone protein DnaK n=1 Tax=Camellia lanceoleosa TaxID=1840588 RepID=A0ACC0FZK9_9ERIC|nr:Chaperone protein DnaK [Camellia lanceoleosa]